jgi:hypothetical protein
MKTKFKGIQYYVDNCENREQLVYTISMGLLCVQIVVLFVFYLLGAI